MFGAGVFRYSDENLGQVEFGVGIGRAGLLAHELVDFEVRHLHPRIYVAFTHTDQDELVAQLLAVLGLANTVSRQASAQRGHVDLVLCGHVLFGLVYRQIIDADARFFGKLQLRLLVDHALQYQAGQFGIGRAALPALRQLRCQALRLLAHLGVGDGLGVDDGHDEVGSALRTARGRFGTHGSRLWGGDTLGVQRAQALCLCHGQGLQGRQRQKRQPLGQHPGSRFEIRWGHASNGKKGYIGILMGSSRNSILGMQCEAQNADIL